MVRLTEYGDVDATPAPRPTGLTVGEAGLRTLFITPASDGLTPEVAPHEPFSGLAFALGMGASGWAEPEATLNLG